LAPVTGIGVKTTSLLNPKPPYISHIISRLQSEVSNDQGSNQSQGAATDTSTSVGGDGGRSSDSRAGGSRRLGPDSAGEGLAGRNVDGRAGRRRRQAGGALQGGGNSNGRVAARNGGGSVHDNGDISDGGRSVHRRSVDGSRGGGQSDSLDTSGGGNSGGVRRRELSVAARGLGRRELSVASRGLSRGNVSVAARGVGRRSGSRRAGLGRSGLDVEGVGVLEDLGVGLGAEDQAVESLGAQGSINVPDKALGRVLDTSGNCSENLLGSLGGTTDELDGDGLGGVLGGNSPLNGEGSTSSDDLVGGRDVDGVEIGSLGKGRGDQSQESRDSQSETHLDEVERVTWFLKGRKNE
jgi:hypothetical protein